MMRHKSGLVSYPVLPSNRIKNKTIVILDYYGLSNSTHAHREIRAIFFCSKMASFRRSLNNLKSFLHEDSINNDDSNKEEINSEEEGDGDDDTNDDKQEVTDDELEGEESDSSTTAGLSQALKAQGSTTLKKNAKKKGRKATWSEACINELIDVVCESEYFRKKLIFTNNKAVKNTEVYTKVVKQVEIRFKERGEVFPFSVVQSRTKFKACVSTCKKAAMLRKTASGLKNFMDKKGYGIWFTKLYPLVESRDSCNPDLAEEPSFSVGNKTDAGQQQAENDFGDELQETETNESKDSSKGEIYVPMPPRKKFKKESTNGLLREAVNSFNRIAAQDPTDTLLAHLREEGERNRQHEVRMAEMQMQLFQNMMAMMASPVSNYNPSPTPQQPFAANLGIMNPNMYNTASENAGMSNGFQLCSSPRLTSYNHSPSERQQQASWTSLLCQQDDGNIKRALN